MRSCRVGTGNSYRFKAGASSSALFHLIFDFGSDVDLRHIGVDKRNNGCKCFVRYLLCRYDVFYLVRVLVFGYFAYNAADREELTTGKLLFYAFKLGNRHKIVFKTDRFYAFCGDYIADLFKAFACRYFKALRFGLRRFYITEIRKKISFAFCKKDHSVRKSKF